MFNCGIGQAGNSTAGSSFPEDSKPRTRPSQEIVRSLKVAGGGGSRSAQALPLGSVLSDAVDEDSNGVPRSAPTRTPRRTTRCSPGATPPTTSWPARLRFGHGLSADEREDGRLRNAAGARVQDNPPPGGAGPSAWKPRRCHESTVTMATGPRDRGDGLHRPRQLAGQAVG